LYAYFPTSNSALATQTIIRMILIFLILFNQFFRISFLDEIQLYLIIYLGYLLIVPPILQYREYKKQIEPPIRKTFVTAKEELDKAVTAAADHPEDAMGYVRTAINLSLTHKFSFKKITSMYGFFHDAEQFGLPLPAYSMIYTIFNEGSKRLHEGKIHTNFEVSQAIETITNFIAELEKTEVSQEKINDFKTKCKSVE